MDKRELSYVTRVVTKLDLPLFYIVVLYISLNLIEFKSMLLIDGSNY